MSTTLAVMNTKGGVGKSTIVLALAETVAVHYGKRVLVIDSDAQASVSAMLLGTTRLHDLQSNSATVVDYLISSVLSGAPVDWKGFVVDKVSDVDDAESIFLIPSDMQLTLFEREVSKENLHSRLRTSINALLQQSREYFDLVIVDCPPGLSILTESWLREADYHLSPTKADYVSVCGLEVFRRFKLLNPEMGFAANLGVLVNMKDANSAIEGEYHRWLIDNAENRCFDTALPRTNALQYAAQRQPYKRSFSAKYPGEIGRALRALSEEIFTRIEADEQGRVMPSIDRTGRRSANSS